ncbi:MAG: hypothetical protein ACTTKN_06500 [Phocaeicola sp.]|uniref:hypothetical protein n=1 Tax=Phocaeicola sp. TaxID=2773926 RepID=UPI003FA16EFA
MNLPSVLGIFNGGYAPEMIRMLLDSIPAVVYGNKRRGGQYGNQNARKHFPKGGSK